MTMYLLSNMCTKLVTSAVSVVEIVDLGKSKTLTEKRFVDKKVLTDPTIPNKKHLFKQIKLSWTLDKCKYLKRNKIQKPL